MKTAFLALFAAALLAACQASSTVRDESLGGFRQLQGASLVLQEPLSIPAGRARVFLQRGRLGEGRAVVGGGFDHYRTHCALEIDAVEHDGVTVQPDTFRIARVQHSLTPVVMARPVQLAVFPLAGVLGRDGSSAYYEGYHLWLVSAAQPAVRRLSCYGAYAEPPDLRPPTLGEIRAALGGIAEIRL